MKIISRGELQTMSEKNILDFIQGLLEQHKGFMKWNDVPVEALEALYDKMSFEMRCKLGLRKKGKKKPSGNKIRKAIMPVIEDRFFFPKKGSTVYILVPCDMSELVINALSDKEAISPKVIEKNFPFMKRSDFIGILNELSESGRIRIIMNEKFEARIMLSGGHEERSVISSGEYTRERFKEAFDELERGKIFVNIPELRKKLSWPHDVFDKMIRELRDDRVIQLHVTDLTIFEPEEFFYDEDDNSRMGMVTWNDRQ